MNRVFSLHVPGDSVFHRLGVGWKYLLLLAVTIPALAAANLWVSLGLLALTMVLLALCRVGLRYAWGLPVGLWVLLAVLLGYHLLVGTVLTGGVVTAVGVVLVGAGGTFTAADIL